MTSRTSSGARNAAFDFVKGSLVLVMVLYHWLNYFVGPTGFGYRYLRFLTPSFILITGFLVSHVYLTRYVYDSRELRQRLVQRGLKLLLLFVALNLLVESVPWGRAQTHPVLGGSLVDYVYAVFVQGNGVAAFSILVSIGYFLLMAPVILLIARRGGISLEVIAGVALIATVSANVLGHGNAHLELLAVAMVGLAAGRVDLRRLERLATHSLPLWLVYVSDVVAITIWDVKFPLQVVGVCLSVLLLYDLALRCGSHGLIQRWVVELGKYSLFAYVVQIVALQLLRRGLRALDPEGAALALSLAAGVVLTIAAVQIVGAARAKSTVADFVYRTVFA